MSTFHYLVEIETERESGLIAGRDEQDELILEALQEAEGNISISGIGARSDSDYSVASFSVEGIEKKDLKQINAEYDAAVYESYPSDGDMEDEIKRLKTKLVAAETARKKAESVAKAAVKKLDAGKTSIYVEDYSSETIHYVPDDRPLTFELPGRNEKVRITREKNGVLEVHYEGFNRMSVRPRSGNVLSLHFGGEDD